MNEKEIAQNDALKSLKLNYLKLQEGIKIRTIIKAVMRFGKSKVIIDFLNSITLLLDNIYIIIPKVINIKTWNEEMIKWNCKVNINFLTYKSLHKLENPSIVIFDELQNITPKGFDNCKNQLSQCSLIIGITGTLPRDTEKKNILSQIGFKVDYDLGLEKAIEIKIINNFKINLIYVDLDIQNNVNVKTSKFDFMTSEFRSYKYLNLQVIKNPCKRTYLARASFLYDAKSKIEATKDLLITLGTSKKILIFTKRIEIANILSKYSVYHNNPKNTENIQKFNTKETNILSSVNMLSEGVTFKDIDIVILESFDSNPVNFLQQIGRALYYKENKVINVFLILLKKTVEEDWIYKILPNFQEIKKYHYKSKKFIEIGNK